MHKIILIFVVISPCLGQAPSNYYLPSGRSGGYSNSGISSNQYSRANSPSSQYGSPSSFSANSRYSSGVSNVRSQYARPQVSAGRYQGGGYTAGGNAGYTAGGGGYAGGRGGGYQAGNLNAQQGGYGQGSGNNEPARYEFRYDVSAPEYAVEFGHQEQRDGDNTSGSYYVLLPDGRRQLVEYTADLDGYHPRISYTGGGGDGSAGGRQGGGYSAGGYSSGGYTQGRTGGNYQSGGGYSSRGSQSGY